MIHRQVVNVTVSHIVLGAKHESDKCMMALACKATSPDYTWQVFYNNERDKNGAIIVVHKNKFVVHCKHSKYTAFPLIASYECSAKVNELIDGFDKGARIKPFSVMMEYDPDISPNGTCQLLEEVDTSLLDTLNKPNEITLELATQTV